MTETTQTLTKSSARSSASAQFLTLVHGSGKAGFDKNGFADVLDQAVSVSLDQAASYATQAQSQKGSGDNDGASDTKAVAEPHAERNKRAALSDASQKTDDVDTPDHQQNRQTSVHDTTEQASPSNEAKGEEAATHGASDADDTDLAMDALQTAIVAGPVVVTGKTTASTASNTDDKAAVDALPSSKKATETSPSDTKDVTQIAQTTGVPVTTQQVSTPNTTSDDSPHEALATDEGAQDAAAALLNQMIALRAAQENRDTMKALAKKEDEQNVATDDTSVTDPNSPTDLLADVGRGRGAEKSNQTTVTTNGDDNPWANADQQTAETMSRQTAQTSSASSARTPASSAAFLNNATTPASSPSNGVSSGASAAAATMAANAAANAAAAVGASSALNGSSSTSATNANVLTALSGTAPSGSNIGTMVALKNDKATGSSQTSVVEQVKIQLQKMAKSGDDQVTIQLSPDEMGKIEIKLTFSDDKTVQGTVVADNKATLEALQKDQSGLQQALQDAGLRADPGSLQFSLRGDGSGSFAQNAFGRPSDQGASGSKSWSVGVVSGESETDGDAEEIYNLATGRVNLRV